MVPNMIVCFSAANNIQKLFKFVNVYVHITKLFASVALKSTLPTLKVHFIVPSEKPEVDIMTPPLVRLKPQLFSDIFTKYYLHNSLFSKKNIRRIQRGWGWVRPPSPSWSRQFSVSRFLRIKRV